MKLINPLDDISFCTTHVFLSDVPSVAADVYAARILLEKTRKHLFFFPLTHRTFQTIIATAKAVRGDEDEFGGVRL